jgi:hypothetical protein
VDSGPRVQHEELEGGLVRTHVDASEKEVWVYLDLDARAELPVGEALATGRWDVRFQRFKLESNGGVTGEGSVEVAALPGADFDALTRAPAEGFHADRADGPDENTDTDSAFLEGDGWYSYNILQHKLSPRDVVYVVRTGEARYFKLKMEAYYDAAGSAGNLTFLWGPVEAP